MMSNNKILTVSYGTFSCTLEGFDDSFGTMKAIAEYFRDLAADDRYFGAEPPQPDAEMLARIAEREISRRVEAREQEGRIVLSAAEPAVVAAAAVVAAQETGTVATPAEAAPEPQPETEPVVEVEAVADVETPEVEAVAEAEAPEVDAAEAAETVDAETLEVEIADDASEAEEAVDEAPVPEAPLVADPDVAETAEAFFADHSAQSDTGYEDDDTGATPEAEIIDTPDAPAPDSIAAKLQRIRAVVSQSDDDEDDAMFEDDHGDAFTSDVSMDDVAETEADDESDQSANAFDAEYAPEEEADATDDGDDDLTAVESEAEDTEERVWVGYAGVDAQEDAENDNVLADDTSEQIASSDDETPESDADIAPDTDELGALLADHWENGADTADAFEGADMVSVTEEEATASAEDADTSADSGADSGIADILAQFEEDAAEDVASAHADDVADVSFDESPLILDDAQVEAEAGAEVEDETGSVPLILGDDLRDTDTLTADSMAEFGEDSLVADLDVEVSGAEAGENLFEEDDVTDEGEAPRRARIIKVKRADIDAAIASGEIEAVEDETEYAEQTSSLTEEQEAELLADLAQVEAEMPTAEDAEAADDAGDVAEDAAFEDAETADTQDSSAVEVDDIAAVAGDDTLTDDVEEAVAEAGEDMPAHTFDDVAAMTSEEPAKAVKDDDVSRLMAEADSQMEEPEGSRRRNAFQHLKAAVMARKADARLGDDTQKDEGAFRSDLESVVVPRRPAASAERTERPSAERPAPLKLVAEQRVDLDGVASGPVRPRRVENADEAGDAAAEGSFADYAAEMGAHSLPDLLEAAASYLSFVEGRDQFSRPQLMTKVRQVEKEDFSREDGLRSFGQLLRAGKIEKLKGGRFVVTGDIGYRPDNRAAG